METNIQIFKNSQFGEVRITEVNGELHFVAKDVAEKLGYTGTARVLTTSQKNGKV